MARHRAHTRTRIRAIPNDWRTHSRNEMMYVDRMKQIETGVSAFGKNCHASTKRQLEGHGRCFWGSVSLVRQRLRQLDIDIDCSCASVLFLGAIIRRAHTHVHKTTRIYMQIANRFLHLSIGHTHTTFYHTMIAGAHRSAVQCGFQMSTRLGSSSVPGGPPSFLLVRRWPACRRAITLNGK